MAHRQDWRDTKTHVYGWQDIRRAVFQISKKKTNEHMFIVWDLELNVELNNFSLKGDQEIMRNCVNSTIFVFIFCSWV